MFTLAGKGSSSEDGIKIIGTGQGITGLNSTPVVVNVPAGVQDGDIILGFTTVNGFGVINEHASFTTLRRPYSTAESDKMPYLYTFYRVASSEPTSYSFSKTATIFAGGVLVVIRGCSIGETGDSCESASSPLTVTGVTAAQAGRLILIGANASTSSPSATGFDSLVATLSGSGVFSGRVYIKKIPAGATGDFSLTGSAGSGTIQGHTLTLRRA
jgi:hypothetical protein